MPPICSLTNSIGVRLAAAAAEQQPSANARSSLDTVDEPLASSSSELSEALAGADPNQLLARIDLHTSEARHAVSRCEEDQQIQCDPNFPYRHADGRCNNLQKPTWGKANTCFARLLTPDYSDGQGAPRISVTGHPLPNPRILSAIVHRDFNYPATYTHFVMQYGQFFAHDIAFTPSSRTSKYPSQLPLFSSSSSSSSSFQFAALGRQRPVARFKLQATFSVTTRARPMTQWSGKFPYCRAWLGRRKLSKQEIEKQQQQQLAAAADRTRLNKLGAGS